MGRDIQKQRNWIKNNYENIVGVRVVQDIWVLDHRLNPKKITPTMFFSHKKVTEPYTEFESGLQFHIPRSLCKRARIQINKNTNEIVGTSKMYSKNK